MTHSAIESRDALRNAYRATFQEYADKLNALQRLIDSAAGSADAETERALNAVDEARIAHSDARDRLARELMGCAASVADEQQIRKTARLIWEFAGRPEGTAESDWDKAEKLVQSAAC